MLVKTAILDQILAGSVTQQFRYWKRRTVKEGGSLTTCRGVIAITSLQRASLESLSEEDATLAGFANLESLLRELQRLRQRSGGELYRIGVAFRGEDPRVSLRDEIVDKKSAASLLSTLQRMDQRSSSGPWTLQYLRMIRDGEGIRAAQLAADCGMDDALALFKGRVRRLKAKGLTESLPVGYRLSPRGHSLLRWT